MLEEFKISWMDASSNSAKSFAMIWLFQLSLLYICQYLRKCRILPFTSYLCPDFFNSLIWLLLSKPKKTRKKMYIRILLLVECERHWMYNRVFLRAPVVHVYYVDLGEWFIRDFKSFVHKKACMNCQASISHFSA